MKPILYESDNLNYTILGKGKLAEAISCTVTEELNGDYSLELKYPVTGGHLADLYAGGTIFALVPSQGADATFEIHGELFDIVKHSAAIDGVVTFSAKHVSRRLAKAVRTGIVNLQSFPWENAYPSDFAGISFAIDHNPDPVTFQGSIALSAPKSVLALMMGDDESYVHSLGGEWFFFCKTTSVPYIAPTICNAQLRKRRGSETGAAVRFGYNMLDVNYTKDKTGAFNALVPYWTDGESVTVYVQDYLVYPTEQLTPVLAMPMDCSSYFEEQPTPEELAAFARQWLDDNKPWEAEETLEADFFNGAEIDPHAPDVQLGDTLAVYWGEAMIAASLRVVSYTYDVLAERYASMRLGTPQTEFVAVTGDTLNAGTGSATPTPEPDLPVVEDIQLVETVGTTTFTLPAGGSENVINAGHVTEPDLPDGYEELTHGARAIGDASVVSVQIGNYWVKNTSSATSRTLTAAAWRLIVKRRNVT